MSKIKCAYQQREQLHELLKQPMEAKIHLLQNYNEMVNYLANDILEELCQRYCGRPYESFGRKQFVRYGTNPGSLKIDHENIPVKVPRVKDKDADQVFNVPEYKDMKQQYAPSEDLLKAIAKGVSTRDYQEVFQHIAQGLGLSDSRISEAFKQESSEKLRTFQERDLTHHDLVALMIDGKYLAREQMIIVLGITSEGFKIPLDFIQATTEHHRPIKELLANLKQRGLSFEAGLLVCIDGAKGLHKAVEEVFGHVAFIQRCQWHKRANVLSYLPDKHQEHYKRKIQQAYHKEAYCEAKQELEKIAEELNTINKSAARSLQEGLEETLTLHRLAIPLALRSTFATTNCIENLNSQLGKYLGKVKRWRNSDQRERWVAVGLMEIEGKMRRISNYKRLSELQLILKNQLNKQS